MSIEHSTFTLERDYPSAASTVFAAWRDEQTKREWFAPTSDHYELDFRPGGQELLRATVGDEGTAVVFAAAYHDIVEDRRIVFSSALTAGDGGVSTLAITTVELTEHDGGTRLTLTEQGTFLDGWEQPDWREKGTGDWLDALGRTL